MAERPWIIGCLTSACRQAAKLALVWFTAWSASVPLDVRTLAISVSVGFLWGLAEWVYTNGVPDEKPVVTLTLPPKL
jgi:hypothetical protein